MVEPKCIDKYSDICKTLFKYNNKDFNIEIFDLENPEILEIIGYYYYRYGSDIEKSKLFFFRSFEKGNIEAINKIGYIYRYEEENIEKAIEYYTIGLNLHSIDSIKALKQLYLGNRPKFVVLMVMEQQLLKCNDLTYYYINGFLGDYNLSININLPNKYYNILYIHSQLSLNKDKFSDKIKELEETEQYKIYINKIELLKIDNILENCIVCAENNIFVCFKCNHNICVECFPKMNNKCYYNCILC